jgi:YL1 nuclear protein C-terminal domain/YL1 nuclear protein
MDTTENSAATMERSALDEEENSVEDETDEEESDDDDSDVEVIAAVTQRSRRETAGKRMTSLVGEALEQDSQFWNHETWNEDDSEIDSANASFHSSDENSEQARDEFDSDFDASEDEDDDASTNQNGSLNDSQHKRHTVKLSADDAIRKEERQSKQAARAKRIASAMSGPGAFRKRKGPGKRAGQAKNDKLHASSGAPGIVVRQKRILGDGLNSGIVLGQLPPPESLLPFTTQSIVTSRPLPTMKPSPIAEVDQSSPSVPTATDDKRPGKPLVNGIDLTLQEASTLAEEPTELSPKKVEPKTSRKRPTSSAISPSSSTGRTRRSPAKKVGRVETASDLETDHASDGDNKGTRKRRREFTQEELLVEAVQSTEPENKRWLLARVRIRDQATKDSSSMQPAARDGASAGKISFGGSHSGTLVERYTSRRGYLNTVHFPEMDHVPAIFQHQSHQRRVDLLLSSCPAATACVVTGKTGRYRDPATGFHYHDASAYAEIQRRRTQQSGFRQQIATGKESVTLATSSISHLSSAGSRNNTDKHQERNAPIGQAKPDSPRIRIQIKSLSSSLQGGTGSTSTSNLGSGSAQSTIDAPPGAPMIPVSSGGGVRSAMNGEPTVGPSYSLEPSLSAKEPKTTLEATQPNGALSEDSGFASKPMESDYLPVDVEFPMEATRKTTFRDHGPASATNVQFRDRKEVVLLQAAQSPPSTPLRQRIDSSATAASVGSNGSMSRRQSPRVRRPSFKLLDNAVSNDGGTLSMSNFQSPPSSPVRLSVLRSEGGGLDATDNPIDVPVTTEAGRE